MNISDRLKLRRAEHDRIIASKKPTSLEKRILDCLMPEEVKEIAIRNYYQLYYNEHKTNRSERTDVANEFLMKNIGMALLAWEK